MTEIDQIWAEALAKYRGGEQLILTGEVEQIAYEEQRDMELDDREGIINDYLETLLRKTGIAWIFMREKLSSCKVSLALKCLLER